MNLTFILYRGYFYCPPLIETGGAYVRVHSGKAEAQDKFGRDAHFRLPNLS